MICNGNWSEDYDEYKKMTHLVLEKHQYLQTFTLLIENSCRIGIYDKFTIGKHVFERKLGKIISCVFVEFCRWLVPLTQSVMIVDKKHALNNF